MYSKSGVLCFSLAVKPSLLTSLLISKGLARGGAFVALDSVLASSSSPAAMQVNVDNLVFTRRPKIGHKSSKES